jgi:hypothetical protein
MGTDIEPGKVKTPQTWDRYLYTQDNPLKGIDPNGKNIVLAVAVTAVVAATVVAVVHAVRMQTDPKYRESVVDGAKRTAETATAVASSVLSKRTDKNDEGEIIAGGSSANTDRGGRGGRGRFKSYEDALDQLGSIEKVQDKLRKGKVSGVIIDEIEKSEQRLKTELDRIKKWVDLHVEDEDNDSGEESGGGKKEPKKK